MNLDNEYNDENILILGDENGDGVIIPILRNGDIKIYPVWKKCIKKYTLCRQIFHFQYSFSLPKIDIWLNFKNISLEKYDIIILLQCIEADKIIKYIRKKNKKCRIIYWLWDTIGTLKNPVLYDFEKETINLISLKDKLDYKCEIWSFDRKNCSEYNLYYNNQFLYKYNIKSTIKKYDCFFIGQDKGRLNLLLELEQILKSKNLNYKFLVKIKKISNYNMNTNIDFINKNIDYKNILKYISESKCLIDLVQKKQSGLTWRPLEAMFYKKKLITNFEKIVEYDFYNSKNIFILGRDDISNIGKFINSEYEEVPKDIVNKYTIYGWLKNFIKFEQA